jgi:hypothetical protein
MRIVCIKWGDKYGDDYVLKLKRGCERYIPHDEFWCMTDKPVPGVTCIPLNTEFPTWWSKIGLFRHGYFTSETLYLDLDIVITDRINPFLEAFRSDKSKLWALDDFSYSIRPWLGKGNNEESGWLGGPQQSTINSSVMMWDKSRSWQFMRTVYDDFTPEVMDELHGDQNWITRKLWPNHIALFPEGVAGSWKYHKGEKYPLVVFHGDPKPHDIRDGWVPDTWVA